ncbi:MAG: hypothetical protein DCC49_07100 [Acidobacteria bacterium]|nr:MAG: hypothetical protein DCC49_07100 [Acidobacteriota bacterium]
MTGTVREYLYAGGEAPTAMRARQADGTYKNYFFVTNTHGDVVALTDKDGNVVNRYAYGPWGEATRVSEQVHQPFRYAGYRYEDGFDLYYLRARWMDPGTGRFLSRDPLAGDPSDLKSMNRYAYASASPATLTDPAGLSARLPSLRGVRGESALGPGLGSDNDMDELQREIDEANDPRNIKEDWIAGCQDDPLIRNLSIGSLVRAAWELEQCLYRWSAGNSDAAYEHFKKALGNLGIGDAVTAGISIGQLLKIAPRLLKAVSAAMWGATIAYTVADFFCYFSQPIGTAR